jgi:pyroglutamyl-peptidase
MADLPPLTSPIVVSGFESFNGREVNASSILGKSMAKGQADVGFLELPVRWGEPGKWVARWKKPPRAWLALGEAATTFRLEAMASNRRVAHLDNAGELPTVSYVRRGGPPLLCTAPLPEMAAAMTAAGYPVAISENAGGYLCDELFYELLHHQAHVWKEPCLALFLHIPVFGTPLPGEAPDQKNPPRMDEAYFAAFGKVFLRVVRALLP